MSLVEPDIVVVLSSRKYTNCTSFSWRRSCARALRGAVRAGLETDGRASAVAVAEFTVPITGD
jgi:hypothetical protein